VSEGHVRLARGDLLLGTLHQSNTSFAEESEQHSGRPDEHGREHDTTRSYDPRPAAGLPSPKARRSRLTRGSGVIPEHWRSRDVSRSGTMHVWGEASSSAFTTLMVMSAAALLTAGAYEQQLAEPSDGGSRAAASGSHTRASRPSGNAPARSAARSPQGTFPNTGPCDCLRGSCSE